MDKTALANKIRRQFPIFSQSELINEMVEKGQLLDLPANFQILDVGSIINVIPLVFEGAIKVVREDENGNEIFLYYIKSWESCDMTLSSGIRRGKSAVKAISQSETKVLAVPVEAIYRFMHKYPSWSDFMVETYALRFDEMLDVIDSVCFHRMDFRLLRYLLDKQNLSRSSFLNISHQEIAADLNTSREVISRMLKQIEKKGAINLSRGRIEIIDLDRL
jgi:CRP/FNR family transcriptional regulator